MIYIIMYQYKINLYIFKIKNIKKHIIFILISPPSLISQDDK